MIVRDIINTALYDIGVVPPGGEISDEFYSIGLSELNVMLKLFAIEGLMLNAFSVETLTLIPSQASYTISEEVGSDFLVARPSSIHSAFIRVDTTDTVLEVFNSLNEYNEYTMKSTQGMPDKVFYHALAPTGKLYFYPTPDTAYSCNLTSEKQLASSIFTTDTILFPDEYEFMLSKNLAKVLMPKFGRTDANIIQMADYAKQTISNNNARIYLQESKFDRLITYPLCR